MKITLASYHTVMLRHGGPKIQIHQTKKYLERLGLEVALIDVWQDREGIFQSDLFHLFASNFGTYDLARYLNAHGARFVISPIFFTRRSPRTIRLACAVDGIMRRIAPGIWFDYGFARDICRWADRCLPNTTEERKLLTEGLGIPEEKVRVIPNGVEEKYLHGDPDLFYNQYGVKDFVLNVGHVGVVRKNTLSLIRALEKIDAPSVIIGRVYPSKEATLCLEEAKKNKNLLIIQGLDHDSPLLASAYAACDVFVLPARYETPGIAALEAALAGAKVVITPYGGTKDYFSDMAVYVDPYSVDSIKRGIEASLNQSGTDTLKNHIKNNFLWQQVAEKTAEVYAKIID